MVKKKHTLIFSNAFMCLFLIHNRITLCALQKIRQFNDALEGVKRAEEDLKNSDVRVFTKSRQEFGKWQQILDAQTIKSEFIIRM